MRGSGHKEVFRESGSCDFRPEQSCGHVSISWVFLGVGDLGKYGLGGSGALEFNSCGLCCSFPFLHRFCVFCLFLSLEVDRCNTDLSLTYHQPDVIFRIVTSSTGAKIDVEMTMLLMVAIKLRRGRLYSQVRICRRGVVRGTPACGLQPLILERDLVSTYRPQRRLDVLCIAYP